MILIRYVDALPSLFHKIILSTAVRDEFEDAPPSVREWVAAPPSWVEIRDASHASSDPALAKLDAGEKAGIVLAIELRADPLLMDKRDGVKAARRRRLEITGTLGFLARAADAGLLNLTEAFDRIKHTNFRYRQETLDALLRERGENGKEL